MSMLFVDVRGSTSLAEKVSPTDYSRLMNRFYASATKALIETDGFVIDVVGDEVVGLYPPGFSGAQHARKAVDAARQLLRAGGDQLPMGVAVHTGISFIGTVMGAEEGIADVRAMGDAINIAARLASQAGAGEALISDAAYAAAGLQENLEARRLTLKGKSEPVAVRVMHAVA
jgi:adenylate cyclase